MRINLKKPIYAGVFVMVAIALLTMTLTSFAADDTVAFEPSQGAAVADDPSQNPYAVVYKSVSPSVVAISVLTELGGGSGSGFVIDKQGHIITNNHVVEGATTIEVEFLDGTLARGEVVGLDPDSDLAVIQVDVPENRLVPVQFADSDSLYVGQDVMAIGSPFGQEWTLTRGIVSALERTIRGTNAYSIGGAIQTDTPINPGNSGGPLLDLKGNVIGVNSQILSSSGSNSGIGFAIPANLTQRVAADLIAFGSVDYSFIGISGGEVTLALIESLDLPNNLRGVVVGEAVANGPAQIAGIQNANFTQQGTISNVDIITKIDDTPIYTMEDLISYLARSTRPGDTVRLTILRNGVETLEFDVTLQSRT